MRRIVGLALLALIGATLITPPLHAANSKIKKLAKQTGIAPSILEEIKADRLYSPKLEVRRSLIRDIAAEPRAEHLPILVLLGLNEKRDEPTRRAAIRLYSHAGLLADRRDIRKHLLPAVKKVIKMKKRGQDQRRTFEELNRLSKWFRLDSDIADVLGPVFEGRDFNLRSLAFRSLCTIEHQRLEQELLVPACLKVYGSTKGYSLFDRFNAVRVLQDRKIEAIAPQLRDNMLAGKDPKMQMHALYTFVEWKDPSTLGLAQKIDTTAVHKMRRAAFRVRTALNDQSCIETLVSWLAKDNINIIQTSLMDLGKLSGERVEKMLERAYEGDLYPGSRAEMWRRKNEPQTIAEEKRRIKLAAAVGLARKKNPKGMRRLKRAIEGDDEVYTELERSYLCDHILRIIEDEDEIIPNELVDELLISMLNLRGETFEEFRRDAIILVGERKVKDAQPALKKMYWDKSNWGHIKFYVGVSLFELGYPKALKDLIWYMPKYKDDITERDLPKKGGRRAYIRSLYKKIVLGNELLEVNRWLGSGYIDVLRKFEKTKDPRMVPLILEMLKPIKVGETKGEPEPAKPSRGKKPKKRGTRERSKEKLDDGQPKGPEPIYAARNQFVRAKAVEVAALIAGEDAKEVLALAIKDYRSVVRAAALRGIGQVSGRYKLPIGASLEEELKARPAAIAWLVEQGVRQADE